MKEYFASIKNNPRGYWFKAKRYGWGWVPAHWQGWAVLVAFIALVVMNFFRIDAQSHSVSDTLINVVPQTIVLALLLIAICWKTGERPRWQWGPPKR